MARDPAASPQRPCLTRASRRPVASAVTVTGRSLPGGEGAAAPGTAPRRAGRDGRLLRPGSRGRPHSLPGSGGSGREAAGRRGLEAAPRPPGTSSPAGAERSRGPRTGAGRGSLLPARRHAGPRPCGSVRAEAGAGGRAPGRRPWTPVRPCPRPTREGGHAQAGQRPAREKQPPRPGKDRGSAETRAGRPSSPGGPGGMGGAARSFRWAPGGGRSRALGGPGGR